MKREPHTPAGRLRRENDCRLFIQRICSKRRSYNVTELTEKLDSSTHIFNKFDTLDALFSHKICCVVIVKFVHSVHSVQAFLFFCKMEDVSFYKGKSERTMAN